MTKFSGVEDSDEDVIPCIFPNWDHTPRSGKEGVVLRDSTPILFDVHVKKVIALVKDKPDEKRIVFIKSWNEWAEGNHMEPDLRYGHQYLQTLKDNLK